MASRSPHQALGPLPEPASREVAARPANRSDSSGRGLDDAGFTYLQGLLARTSGLGLWPEKRSFVEARLFHLAERLGLGSVSDVIARLQASGGVELESLVNDVLTTHETSFFRDRKPFEQFEAVVLPHLLRSRAASRHIRIWCAGVSSGQEAYSLAMILADQGTRLRDWTVDLIATDLSPDVIEKARRGRYNHFEVQRGLPITALLDHFTKRGLEWELSDTIRAMVDFRVLNLNRPFPPIGPFDLILCRNVLIHFDAALRLVALDRILAEWTDDGFFVLGATESPASLTRRLVSYPGHRGLYIRAR